MVDWEHVRRRYDPVRLSAPLRFLLVGESPPPRSGTFFYSANSILFRETRKAFTEAYGKVAAEGEAFLRQFQRNGFYLVDLWKRPETELTTREIAAGSQRLTRLLRQRRPDHVITVKVTVHPHVDLGLKNAGLPTSPPHFVSLPFPTHYAWKFKRDLVAFLLANCAVFN
ncbi:MAG: hypothetical protein HYS09_09250 [Chloroflexi bacterium]|nr:hypothetical protein [Chloroflexota bacterium]